MAARKGRFVTPEEIDKFLDDLASDFEVSDTFHESDNEGTCLMLFTEIFRGYFTFFKDFYGTFFLGKSVFFILHLDLLEVVIMVVMVFCCFFSFEFNV